MFNNLETSYAWVGGIIDGEGCISCDKRMYTDIRMKNRTYYYISVRLGMKGCAGKHVVEKVQEIARCGEVYESHNVFTYVCHGGQAKLFLERLQPYIFSKQDQVEAALEFFEDGNKEAIYWKMRLQKQLSYK